MDKGNNAKRNHQSVKWSDKNCKMGITCASFESREEPYMDTERDNAQRSKSLKKNDRHFESSLQRQCQSETYPGKAEGTKNYPSSVLPPIKGIPNTGMSCYANSIFQVLAQTKVFKTSPSGIGDKGVSGILHDLLTSIRTQSQSRRNNIVNRNCVRQLLDKVSPMDGSFSNYQQRDGMSFLMSLVDDLKRENKTEKDRKSETRTWTVFEGEMVNYFRFHPCQCERSSSIQTFINIPIPTPDKEKYTIEDGLQELFKETFNSDDDMIKCKKHSTTKETEKKLCVKKFPTALILKLERSEETSSGYPYKLQKNYRYIEYKTSLKVFENPSLENRGTAIYYNLYGVISHRGSLRGGHYTAFVKHHATDTWFECDDEYITQVAKKSVFHNGAYLLFYQRCEASL